MSDDNGPWSRLPPPAAKQTPLARPRPHIQRRLIIIGACAALVIGGVWLARQFPAQLGRANWSDAAYAVGMFVVVFSALLSRRLKFGQVARYGAIWAAIALVLLVGYALRDDLAALGPRLMSEIAPSYAVPVGGRTLVLSQSDDGGFYLTGAVNGVPVRFLIDTGAGDIVLSPDDARRVGVDLAALKFDHGYETANGIGRGAAYTVSNLEAGPIRLGPTPVSINQAPMSQSLLGMAFLKRLDFEFKGRQLILRGRGGA